jgi:hypothetical protein
MPCPYPKLHCRELLEIRRRQCRVPTRNYIVGKRHCRLLYIILVQPLLIRFGAFLMFFLNELFQIGDRIFKI